MKANRIEAFSDGVLAIILTIMVLDLNEPGGQDLSSLVHQSGTNLLTYLLSFVYVGIYWNNHHHLFQLSGRVGGAVLWANLHLLFWVSLFPFTTKWMHDTDFARFPVVTYGVDLLGAAVAYFLLQVVIIRSQHGDSMLQRALGRDLKGKISPVIYIAGIACALTVGDRVVAIWLATGAYIAVAVMWLVPDRRIERALEEAGSPD